MNTSLILKRFLASKRAGKTSHCRTSVQMPPTAIIHFDLPRLSRNFHLKTVRAFKKFAFLFWDWGWGVGGWMFSSKLSSTCVQVQVQVTDGLEEREDLALSAKVFHTYFRKSSGRRWSLLWVLRMHRAGLTGTGLACEACVSLASGSTDNLYYLLL